MTRTCSVVRFLSGAVYGLHLSDPMKTACHVARALLGLLGLAAPLLGQAELAIRVLDAWAETAVADASVDLMLGDERLASAITDANGEALLSFEAPTHRDAEAIPGAFIGTPYPNPTSGRVSVPFRLATSERMTLEVRDMLGRRVAREARRLGAGGYVANAALDGLAPGTYVLSFRSEGQHAESDRLFQVVSMPVSRTPTLEIQPSSVVERGPAKRASALAPLGAGYRVSIAKDGYLTRSFAVAFPQTAVEALYLAADPSGVAVGGLVVAQTGSPNEPLWAVFQDSAWVALLDREGSEDVADLVVRTSDGTLFSVSVDSTGTVDHLFAHEWIYVFDHFGDGVVDLAALSPDDSLFVLEGLPFTSSASGKAALSVLGPPGPRITIAQQALSASTCAIQHARGPEGLPQDAPSPLGCSSEFLDALLAGGSLDEGTLLGSAPGIAAYVRPLGCGDDASNPPPAHDCLVEASAAVATTLQRVEAALSSRADRVDEARRRLRGGASYTNSIGMEFALIQGGTYQMGAEAIPQAGNFFLDERPVHEVTLSKDFYLGVFEVTQKQWKAVMQEDPSFFPSCPGEIDENCPVEQVSWDDVQAFIQALNNLEGTTLYRLPTEAEWEYAARAGTTTQYSFNEDYPPLRVSDYAWYAENSGYTTHPVGMKLANPWGLFDVHGNVGEWVQDRYGPYAPEPATDPTGPTDGTDRVIRSGVFGFDMSRVRSAFRQYVGPATRSPSVGFRLARSRE